MNIRRMVPPQLRRALAKARKLLRATRSGPVSVEAWAPDFGASVPERRGPTVTSQPPPPSSDRLRCLLVVHSLDSGGVEEFVALMARRLPERGFAVAVAVAPSTGPHPVILGPLADRLGAEGIEILYHSDRATALRMFEAWAPDVVSMHAGATWAIETLADRGVPVVETLHGMHNLSPSPEVGVLQRLRLLRGIVAVSDIVATQYRAAAGSDAPAAVVIPNGVDPTRLGRVDRVAARTALGIGDEPLVVSLARYSLQKNTYALVAAFDEVAGRIPGARLLVCGRVEEAAYARRIAALRRRLRHGDRIRLRAGTSRTDLLLSAADAFVLDSFFEGWSLASMEALGSGVPVVSSEVGGAREQLDGGVARGVLIDNPLGDPVAVDWDSMAAVRYRRQRNRGLLVDALAGLLDGSVPTARRSDIAEYSLERFRDDHCIAAHARLLQDVVG